MEDVIMDAESAIEADGDDGVDEEARLRGESLRIVRDLILKAHADVVPELVRGETLAELMGSVEPARAAFRRLVETVKASAPVVPAGGAGSPAVAIETLTADGMIKRALAQARR